MKKKKKFKEPIAEVEPVDKLPEVIEIQSDAVSSTTAPQSTTTQPQPERRSFLQRMRDRRPK